MKKIKFTYDYEMEEKENQKKLLMEAVNNYIEKNNVDFPKIKNLNSLSDLKKQPDGTYKSTLIVHGSSEDNYYTIDNIKLDYMGVHSFYLSFDHFVATKGLDKHICSICHGSGVIEQKGGGFVLNTVQCPNCAGEGYQYY